MIPAKKVEIIIEAIKTKKVIGILERLSVEGYTILQDASGAGTHGKYDAEELTDVFKNTFFIIVCDEKKAEELASQMLPILKKYGGICYMSDVQRVDITK